MSFRLLIESLESRQLLTADPIITEFMARNDGGLEDGDGRSPDWIEIQNAGDEALDLAGYRLTNDHAELGKWVFPSVVVDPGQYLVVFASGQETNDYVDPQGNPHTNFTLRRGGDYIGLVSPEGTVVSEFGMQGKDFPEQLRNVSYGTAQSLTLISEQSQSQYWVPAHGNFGLDWTEPDFDGPVNGFQLGTAALGLETRPQNRTNFSEVITTSVPDGTHALYTRFEFELQDASAISSLLLNLKHDNGIIVYLNGQQIFEENAGNNPGWFSTAPANTPRDSRALEFAPFDLTPHTDKLTQGKNVLAIHLLNHLSDNSDLLLVPQLVAGTSDMLAVTGNPAEVGFMTHSTPGDANVSNAEVFSGFVLDAQFSVEHGFFTEPFDVELTTQDEGAVIRYTIDGTEPSQNHGMVYEGPITISGTTVLRAAATKPDFIPSRIHTQSYFFLNDVLLQSPNGEAPPGFPEGPSVSGQQLNYGMDPDIVNDDVWGPQLIEALSQVPTFSIVTEPGSLFDPSTGIYTHADRHGFEWERPASMEVVDPDGDDGFQINAGLRIRGGFSRTGSNPKHAFRMFFSNDYDGTLEYAFFGDEGVDAYKKMDLRTTQNYSWSFQNDAGNTFLRDIYSRDVQRDMGQPYTRGRYYHLYLNGHYWGLFQTQERSEAAFAESYFGGAREDYDTIKHQVAGGRRSVATDGNMDAFFRLYDATVKGYENNDDYYRVQGLNPDGTRNPEFERLVDVDNLIDYMIITYFTGDRDGPGSRFTAPAPNNYFGIINRENPDGFKWFEHDSEHTLDRGERNMVSPLTINHGGFRETNRNNFNPHWLHEELMKNDEYWQRFTDRVQLHMFNGGVLTTEESFKLLDERMEQFDVAIIAESARWGDAQRNDRQAPFTKDDWERAVARTKEWFLGRRDTSRVDEVIDQLRNQDYFPAIDAPSLNQHGGVVPDGFEVTISVPQGTVYFTVDGSDPRQVGGGLSSSAIEYTGALALTERTELKARSLNDGQWSAVVEAEFDIQSTLPLRVTELNYNPYDAVVPISSSGEQDAPNDGDSYEFVELMNVGGQSINLEGVQFVQTMVRVDQQGIRFEFTSQELAPGQRIVIVRDRSAFDSRYGDGIRIANGEHAEANPNGQYGGRLSNGGERLTLLDAQGLVIQQFDYSDAADWPARADGAGSSLEIIDPHANYSDPTNWRASSEFGGSPGRAGRGPQKRIAISEIVSNSPEGGMIELQNLSAHDVDITGWFISNSGDDYFKHQLDSPGVVSAFGYHVIRENDLSFELNDRGDQVWLVSADARGNPLGFEDQIQFSSSLSGVSLGPWPTTSDSFIALATPTFGQPNDDPFIDDVVIGEIHFNPADPDGNGRLRADDFEFIEVFNRSDGPVDISGWRLTGEFGSARPTDYTFPDSTTIGSQEALTIVGFDPADLRKPNVFKFTHGMPLNAPLFGPYSEDLGDESGVIRLDRPQTGQDGQPGPLVTVDKVRFDSVAPWPSSTAGTGDALARTSSDAYGNLPISWVAAAPTPGSAQFAPRSPGDANEDGQFDQNDIQSVLQAGKFMTGQPATWAEGDWTGDGLFNQLDVVAALQAGTYNLDPLAAHVPLSNRAVDAVLTQFDWTTGIRAV